MKFSVLLAISAGLFYALPCGSAETTPDPRLEPIMDYLNLGVWKLDGPVVENSTFHLEFITGKKVTKTSSLNLAGRDQVSVVIRKDGSKELMIKSGDLSVKEDPPQDFDFHDLTWLEKPAHFSPNVHLLGYKTGKLTDNPRYEDFEIMVLAVFSEPK